MIEGHVVEGDTREFVSLTECERHARDSQFDRHDADAFPDDTAASRLCLGSVLSSNPVALSVERIFHHHSDNADSFPRRPRAHS